ncbi:MAG: hypothetical protein AAFQ80_07930 [Cyanobacteria bacterium J06621_8]
MIEELIKQAKAMLLFTKDSIVYVERELGETLVKQLDPDCLVKAITDTDFTSEWFLDSRCTVHKIKRNQGKTVTVASIKPSAQVLNFKSFTLELILPGTVMVCKQPDLWLYAYKGHLGIQSRLYNFPLPNIDANHKVCWGSVISSLNQFQSPFNLYLKFISSEFNQDYVNNKSRTSPGNVLIQLKKISQSQAKFYPEDDLIRANLVLKDLC